MSEAMSFDEALKNVSDARAKGERPDLHGANLHGADLRGADLSWADLSETNLHGANLHGANLSGADLSRANLSRANLSRADLRGAYLRRADLSETDLIGAYLRRADLREANLRGADLRGAKNVPDYAREITTILPAGDIVGWKKLCNDLVCKLLIPADARRSNATGRKCRCDKAQVLEIWDGDQQVQEGVSNYDSSFTYRVGEWVSVDNFDEDRWNECSGGIHFFITRFEAEDY